jgi:3-hydroxyisobutyrate dehydrogenase-like beta-hydroxyacid dehydrogenase
MTSIAFLGTGLLGSGLIEAALARGDAEGGTLTVWNRTAAKAEALRAYGARVASAPADAVASAALVHLVLSDDAAVEAVLEAARSALIPDALILDHTTTQPAATAARAERLAAEGVRYLHCPVFIGPAAARRSEGAIMASGPKALFDDAHPALVRMAASVHWLGERPDAAAVYKLCGNAFIIGISALVADVYAIAKGAGVAPLDALQVLDIFNPFSTITVRGRNMARGNYTPSFELGMARKDVRLMLDTMGDIPRAAFDGIAARMDALIAAGHGGDDLAVLGKESVTSAPHVR